MSSPTPDSPGRGTRSVNMRSPSIKRILQEMKEIRQVMEEQPDTCPFAAEALEDDVYQWCFAVRGPADTPFAEGIYHGRILLPPEYPFKPPSFIMLSPSGRFETNTKICLSISSFHPEQWQPSWSMRTALTALIAFFPSPSKGAVGSQEASDAERAKLALESRQKVPQVASVERMEVMQRLHAFLLRQSNKPQAEQGRALESTNREGDKDNEQRQPVSNFMSPQADAVTAEAPQQLRVNEAFPTIHAFLRLLDKLIVLVFMLLAILVVWNVILHV